MSVIYSALWITISCAFHLDTSTDEPLPVSLLLSAYSSCAASCHLSWCVKGMRRPTSLLSLPSSVKGCLISFTWLPVLPSFAHNPSHGTFQSLSFSFKKFYWSTVDLQCCVNFCCIAKWLSYTYIHIYIYSFSYSFPFWFFTGYWM